MPPSPSVADALLGSLNPEQRQAASHGDGPLLIVAGAGTGKTATLVHRVAWLIASGTPAERILLLTFTRRSAEEMLRRVAAVLQRTGFAATRLWGGTFHAVSTRLLRRYGKAIGLAQGFTVLDRGDAADLMGAARAQLGFAGAQRRFPQKGVCLDIYSRCVNAREKLADVLPARFPWCAEWEKELAELFSVYVDRKEAAATLDYDDLLLYWSALVEDETVGARIRAQFDHVLVDEYQDTNVLQAEILARLRPDGRGLSVVGDDAQSIYSFRAATVRNILDFPRHYPGTTVIALERNYRSTQPILSAANKVIALAPEGFVKNLWSPRTNGQRPSLVVCQDEDEQTRFVVAGVLENREAGVDLRRQAVLFRSSHHSIILEAELTLRNIPFRKYGGLKYVETAHVKDLMAFLRLAENPRDEVAGRRLLPLLPGFGPARSGQALAALAAAGGRLAAWAGFKPPPAAAKLWRELVALLAELAQTKDSLPSQVARVRRFYAPLLEAHYDNPAPRLRDLEQLEHLAGRYRTRRQMIVEMALDPPEAAQDLAGPPRLDDDYLILSTIHSAKGLEWDAVFVIHAADGNIPSDMATGSAEEIEEERRLFYVALTRAKNRLWVCYPLRYYFARRGVSDQYGFAQQTRFLPPAVAAEFDREPAARRDEEPQRRIDTALTSPVVRQRVKTLWT